MRRLVHIALILFVFSLLFSCENSLELLPTQGKVKEEYWKVKEDVAAVLTGAYSTFASIDDKLFYYGELRGDMLEESNLVDSYLRSVIESNITPNNALSDWIEFYQIINYCNLVIKYSPQVKANDPTFTEFDFEAYNAEAVFLRSLAYFYLVRVFKEVPFVLYPYDADDQEFFIEKTDGEIILDSLDQQLQRIVSKIPLEHETIAETKGRATRGAAYTLLADIALWSFEYEKCIEYTDKVLEQENKLYVLLNGNKWFDIFSKGNTAEGIFELQYDSKLNQDNHLYNLTRESNNLFKVSEIAYELLVEGESQEIVRRPGTLKRENRLIWKYIGSNADGSSTRSGLELRSANFVIYRFADVILMKAEALSQINRFDEAKVLIDRIRTRASLPLSPSFSSAQACEDYILEERAKEFAYEGKRWFDLMRMGRRNNYARKSELIEILLKRVPSTQQRVLLSRLNDPNGWYLPIYFLEMDNNFKLVQNPYYQIYE